ncbi:MAG: hypothetical protein OEN00_15780 [Gemmatimonadota bacterium]|nr:hypothetical protein [Gemmatimonadota bacterium]
MIAEIAGLLALAALFGGALVYWWLRRHLVDVSSEYARYEHAMHELKALRAAESDAKSLIAGLEAAHAQLEQRLADETRWRPALEAKIEGVSSAVANIRPTNIAPVEARLDKIQGVVAKLQNTDVSGIAAGVAATAATVAAIKQVDLAPVTKKLDRVDEQVASTSAAVAAIKSTDLGPVTQRLQGLETKVASLQNADLAPVEARVKSLTDTVRVIESRLKPQPPTDLSGVEKRLDGIESRLKPQPPTDLSGVQKRLDGIEAALKSRPRPAPAARAPRPAAPRKAATKPRPAAGALLQSASHGKADDLKQISGVGPKLEKMLNGIGVYYFFQVEAWSKADVKRVDDLLKVFKGRIERDNWVKQAQTLARHPSAARMK